MGFHKECYKDLCMLLGKRVVKERMTLRLMLCHQVSHSKAPYVRHMLYLQRDLVFCYYKGINGFKVASSYMVPLLLRS